MVTAADVTKVAVSIMLGGALGWGAQALTLGGRVDAIERGLQRVEQLMVMQLRKDVKDSDL